VLNKDHTSRTRAVCPALYGLYNVEHYDPSIDDYPGIPKQLIGLAMDYEVKNHNKPFPWKNPQEGK
jgi:hypothetical protein